MRLTSIVVLVGLIILLGFWFGCQKPVKHYLHSPKKVPTSVLSPSPTEKHKEKKVSLKPLVKSIPKKPAAIKPVLPSINKPTLSEEPIISIIIDDFGNNQPSEEALIALPYPIAISVLPHLAFSKSMALKAAAEEKPVLLHLPVEAIHSNEYLGPGAIFTGMTKDEMIQIIDGDLETVPGVDGVNNHLGSKGTTDPLVTETIVEEAKLHHLFVVDSLTAPYSILYLKAREAGVPEAERDVFLDNVMTEDAITKQFEELISIAKKNGKALAIGHPYAATLHVLQAQLPKLTDEKIKIVPVTEYVNR